LQPFIIPAKGLKEGKNLFQWSADGSFFASFENSEVLDADLKIDVEVDNSEFEMSVKCSISGTVVVVCDRCMENLTLPVETSFEEEDVYDLNQDIYDFVCISLPMQRVHPEGECNEETIKYLNK